jgi:hypothetical protein
MVGIIRAHEAWWFPFDPRDIRQERALAVLEERDPDQAAKDWFRRERNWHRFHCSFPEGDNDFVDAWIHKFYVAVATKSTTVPHRSSQSTEQRKAYVREWWRKNGAEYRRRRAMSRASRAAASESLAAGRDMI